MAKMSPPPPGNISCYTRPAVALYTCNLELLFASSLQREISREWKLVVSSILAITTVNHFPPHPVKLISCKYYWSISLFSHGMYAHQYRCSHCSINYICTNNRGKVMDSQPQFFWCRVKSTSSCTMVQSHKHRNGNTNCHYRGNMQCLKQHLSVNYFRVVDIYTHTHTHKCTRLKICHKGAMDGLGYNFEGHSRRRRPSVTVLWASRESLTPPFLYLCGCTRALLGKAKFIFLVPVS